MRFKFTGKIKFNDDDSDRPSLRVGKTKKGAQYKSLSLGITTDQSNWAFVELFGMVSDVIKTVDVDNQKYEVNWEDRLDEEVVESVANYRKTFVNLTTDRENSKAFVSPCDAIDYIIDNVYDLNDVNVCITGDLAKNEYNGRLTDRFQIRSLYVVDDDVKPSFKVNSTYFFTKDDIDSADWKDEKKIVIDGYIDTYMSSEKANKYVKHPVVFDASKVDYSNEDHIKIKDYNLRQLGLAEEDGKITTPKLKGTKVYGLNMEFAYLNGAELAEFDESTLTDNQKVAIELGLKTIDDFRPNGNIYGDRKTEYKIVGFDLRGDSADGVYELDETKNEFMENTYTVVSQTDNEEETTSDESSDDGLDDLFS